MAADKHEVIFCTDAGKRMDRTAFDSAQIDNDTARFEICNIFFDKINCLLRIERDKYNIGICKNRSILCAAVGSALCQRRFCRGGIDIAAADNTVGIRFDRTRHRSADQA